MFNRRSIQRLRDTVNRVEAMGGEHDTASMRRRRRGRGFYARITNDTQPYEWEKVYHDGTDWQPLNGITGAGAKEINDEPAGQDAIVWLTFVGWDGSEAMYSFAVGGGLPEGSGQYKVLQLDIEDNPIWDWVRMH